MIDLDVHLPMFQYNRDETIVKGDQVLSDGRRVAVFTSNAHLKLLSKTEEVLADGTSREEEERVHCDHLGDTNKIFRSSCLIDLKL